MSDLINLETLSVYLREKLGITNCFSATKTSTGQSNPTFVLETSEGRFVLRRKPPGQLLKSAHAVEREYRVMKALAGHAPVPKMHILCEDADIIGSTFFVMSFVDGDIFAEPELPGLTTDERARVYDQMNAGLAGLHRLDPGQLGLEDFGKPGNYFSRQVARWSKQYEATETEQIGDMERLMGWLADNTPDDDGRVSLSHGDWRIDNLVFSSDTRELIAILDWELSTLGHPFADLGAQLMQWSMPRGPIGRGLEGVDRAALGLPSDAAYVRDYAERLGLTSVPDMTYYIVFAYFRMAAILQGVKKRALQGNASNRETALKLGAYVPVLARKACERITGEG